jgi:hypothetical protein
VDVPTVGQPGAPAIVRAQSEVMLSFWPWGKPVPAQAAKNIVGNYSAAYGNANSWRHRPVAALQNRKLLIRHWQEPNTAIREPGFVEIRRGMGDA